MRRELWMAGLLLAGAACGVSKDEFAAAQRDAAEARRQYRSEAARTAALEQELAAEKAAVARHQQRVGELEASAAQLQQEKGRLEQEKGQLEQEKGQLAARSAQYEQLTSSLQKQIESGQVEISELRGKMTVKLKDKVLFASGSTRLGPEGQAALDAVAEAFRNLTGKTVIVAGYTDDVPTGTRLGFKDNWDLSTARAVTVVRYLQSKGVPPQMLGASGFSQYRPLAPNDTPEGRSQNRRIEIALAADEQPPAPAPAPAAEPQAAR